jgi:hypothetical protein
MRPALLLVVLLAIAACGPVGSADEGQKVFVGAL